MKFTTKHSGLLLTAILVVALLLAGRFLKPVADGNTSFGNASVDGNSSGNCNTQLNLKGMIPHLLDFYK